MDSVREAVAQTPARERVEQVDLVEDELPRHVGGTDLREHALDRGELLDQAMVGPGRVGDVEDEVGAQRLLERGREPLRRAGGAAA